MSKHELILYSVMIIVLNLIFLGNAKLFLGIKCHFQRRLEDVQECLELRRRNSLNLVHIFNWIAGNYTFYISVFTFFLFMIEIC